MFLQASGRVEPMIWSFYILYFLIGQVCRSSFIFIEYNNNNNNNNNNNFIQSSTHPFSFFLFLSFSPSRGHTAFSFVLIPPISVISQLLTLDQLLLSLSFVSLFPQVFFSSNSSPSFFIFILTHAHKHKQTNTHTKKKNSYLYSYL